MHRPCDVDAQQRPLPCDEAAWLRDDRRSPATLASADELARLSLRARRHRTLVHAGVAGCRLGAGAAVPADRARAADRCAAGRAALARLARAPGTLALGVYGLFGFHLLLFVALRDAPPVEANLVNYLWPLLIVLLAPVVLPGLSLRPRHVLAALLGFGGAALAIAGGRELSAAWSWGYVAAAGSALIWATYSLLTRRVAHFPTAAIGGFALLSGAVVAGVPFRAGAAVVLTSEGNGADRHHGARARSARRSTCGMRR